MGIGGAPPEFKKYARFGINQKLAQIREEGTSDKLLDLAFTEYLENALIEFEGPHQMNDDQRLNVYRCAFKKTFKNLLNKITKER